MIVFPKTAAQAVAAAAGGGEYRAGGTDFMERAELGLVRDPIIDLRDLPDFSQLTSLPNGGQRLGAGVTLAELASRPALRSAYPALCMAVGALATPQIRAVATLGGNLLQSTRCWYARHPVLRCYKNGGDTCPARAGDHLFASCFERGPCVAPHPSTVGMALLAYGAEVEIHDGSTRSVSELYGDGADPRAEHQLRQGELLTSVLLPAPLAGERGAYFRAINRAAAEWPLVEVSLRLSLAEGRMLSVGLAMGGVAPIPLRLPAVEALLEGKAPDAGLFEQAAKLACEGATPLPGTAYKLQLLAGSVIEALERATAGEGD